jgi:ABC-2 type transport system permease protein
VSTRAEPAFRATPRSGTLAQHARVLRVMTGTHFKLKYSGSVLGYAWSLLKPLALFTVLYFVFGRFFRLTVGFSQYPLYLLIGLVFWIFFVDATNMTMSSITSNASILRRLSFPRLIVPLSVALSSVLTFLVNLIAIVVLVGWNRITPRLEWLWLIPLIGELVIFTVGFGLILATLYVRFGDVAQVWELGSQLLFYASPIIYPVGFLPPWAQPIAFLSPFVQIIQDVRMILLQPHERVEIINATIVYGTAWGYLLPVGVAVGTLAFGLWLFRRESPWFAERV